MPICANCGAPHPDGVSFCDECGAPLRGVRAPASAASDALHARTIVASRVCPACGAQTSSRDLFCTHCGAAFDGSPRPAIDSTSPGPDTTVVPPAAVALQLQIDQVDTPAMTSVGGAPTTAHALVCAHCGAELQPNNVFCEMCGTRVSVQKTPVAEPNVPALADVRIQQASPIPSTLVTGPGSAMGGRTVMVGAPHAMAAPPVPAIARPPRASLIIRASGAALAFPAGQTKVLVGRQDPVRGIFPEIDLTDHGGDEGGVSRRHAHIAYEDGQFTLEDLNSVNGTFVNGVRVPSGERSPITEGDEIRLGRVLLVFRTS